MFADILGFTVPCKLSCTSFSENLLLPKFHLFQSLSSVLPFINFSGDIPDVNWNTTSKKYERADGGRNSEEESIRQQTPLRTKIGFVV